MAEDNPESPQRWTAKRRATLILSILKGETSAQAAARKHVSAPDGRSLENAEIGSPPNHQRECPFTDGQSGGGTACWDWRTS